MPVANLRSSCASVLAAAAILFGPVVSVVAFTPASATERISVNSTGEEANDHAASSVNVTDVSGDGRYVAFDSYATNVVTGDANGTSDVFLRDRLLATTILVSVDSNESQGNSYSNDSSISADGRYVAFTSGSTNLTLGGSNGWPAVFVRDTVAGTTIRISGVAGGELGSSGEASLSADGRYVAFTSELALVAEDHNGQTDTYVHDRDADGDGIFDEVGATSIVRASVATDGTETNGFSSGRISPNGRFVVLISTATNLIADDQPLCDRGSGPTNCSDVFLHDRDTDGDGTFDQAGGTSTTLVSATGGGAQANGDSGDSDVANDGDVAFWSVAPNLGATAADMFVRDHQTGTVSLAGRGTSNGPSMSDDGRYVAFNSGVPNVVDDSNNTVDAYVFDRQTTTIVRASVDSDGAEVAYGGYDPVLSGDGRHVIFGSFADDLVSGDSGLWTDVFARDLQASPAPPQPQTITFTNPGGKTLAQSPVTVTAAASSGLAVTFTTSTPAVCTSGGPNGAAISLLTTGSCSITASQPGNQSYDPAASVTRTFNVSQASQTITFVNPGAKTLLQSQVFVAATASSGLAVTFSTLTPLVCTVTDTTVTLVAIGSCTVRADQAGDTTYKPANGVNRTFAVNLVNQTITFTALANQLITTPSVTVAATASSGLTVTFTTSTPLVCTAGGTNGGTIDLVAAGTCTVRADQAGDSFYKPANGVNRNFTVTKLAQTISFTNPGAKTLALSPVIVAATASSGLAVSFSTSTPAVCTASGPSGTIITLLTIGTCTVRADQSGDAIYKSANGVNRSFAVR